MTRHMITRGNHHYFQPSKTMRAAGFRAETLGTDHRAATARVERWNDEWDVIRQNRKIEPDIAVRQGDGKWLIDRFQADPTWYGQKAPATREEMDYCFGIIAETFGDIPIRAIERRHCRALYNNVRIEGSPHKAKKVIKWFSRLLEYAVEIGVRDDNPARRLKIEAPQGRTAVWTENEVRAVIATALAGGTAESGNDIPARPSVALAVQIAYDTSLPQQDILALRWPQYDGEGLTVRQKKRRGDRELWIPLSSETLQMLAGTERASTHIVVSEETRRPYTGRGLVFARLFRRFRKRAGIDRDLTFHDLRRTALTELGAAGATNAEIVAFSGHKLNSRVLDDYVKPGREAAKRARKKREG